LCGALFLFEQLEIEMPCYSIDGVVPVVDPSAFVHPTAVLIGDVVIGPGCYVGPCASLRGDFGRIVLRAGANVQDTCVMHGFPNAETVVEENGHIGHGAVLHGCVIRRDALVGMNAVVMDNAEIGAQSMVAACALVTAGEISRKHQGTLIYQELALRCHDSMVEVQPLTEPQDDRHRLRTYP